MNLFKQEFWEKPFPSVLRWIFFIPLYLVSIDLLFYLYGLGVRLTAWLFITGLDTSIDDILGGSLGTILFFGLFLIPFYASLFIRICPKIYAGSIIYMILIVLTLTIRILFVLNKTNGEIGKSILMTVLAMIPYLALFIGAWLTKDEIL